VESGIKINPESCKCRYASNTCQQIVIENRPPSKSSFKLSTLSETLGTNTPQPWDLSTLGLPRHPLFSERVKSLKVTYLALTFSSIQEKDQFVKAFDTISRLRNQDQRDYLEAKARFARRANQPNANEPVRRASTTIFSLSRASTAPTLRSFSFGKDLQDGVAYLTDTRAPSELDSIDTKAPSEVDSIDTRAPSELGSINTRAPLELGCVESAIYVGHALRNRHLPEMS
jgi:hypothetical protein